MATYDTELQIQFLDHDQEEVSWEVSIELDCTYAGCPAKLSGPPEDCYPAEGPEFEFKEFTVFVGKTTIVKSKSPSVAEALFGEMLWGKLMDSATIEAEEEEYD